MSMRPGMGKKLRKIALILFVSAIGAVGLALLIATGLGVGAHDRGAILFYLVEWMALGAVGFAAVLFVLSFVMPRA